MIRALRQQQNFEIRPFRPRLRGMAAVLERAAGSTDLRSCACLAFILIVIGIRMKLPRKFGGYGRHRRHNRHAHFGMPHRALGARNFKTDSVVSAWRGDRAVLWDSVSESIQGLWDKSKWHLHLCELGVKLLQKLPASSLLVCCEGRGTVGRHRRAVETADGLKSRVSTIVTQGCGRAMTVGVGVRAGSSRSHRCLSKHRTRRTRHRNIRCGQSEGSRWVP